MRIYGKANKTKKKIIKLVEEVTTKNNMYTGIKQYYTHIF